MLIDVKSMRLLKTRDTETKYRLIEQNIERFFRDYIFYYNVYDRKELIIDSGYLPYHYLDLEVLNLLIDLLEKKLGYGIIIMKTTNTTKLGYEYGDLINIRLFDPLEVDIKDADVYFNMSMFQPLYSTFHNFNNIKINPEKKPEYLTCANYNFALTSNEKKLIEE